MRRNPTSRETVLKRENLCEGVATLASVRSRAENWFILSLMGGGAEDDGGHHGGWIGGTDEAEEGVWRWMNSLIVQSAGVIRYLPV